MNAENLIIDHKINNNNNNNNIKDIKKKKINKKVKSTIYDKSLKEIYNNTLVVIVNLLNDLTSYDYYKFDSKSFKNIFIKNNRYIYIIFIAIVILQLFLLIKFL